MCESCTILSNEHDQPISCGLFTFPPSLQGHKLVSGGRTRPSPRAVTRSQSDTIEHNENVLTACSNGNGSSEPAQVRRTERDCLSVRKARRLFSAVSGTEGSERATASSSRTKRPPPVGKRGRCGRPVQPGWLHSRRMARVLSLPGNIFLFVSLCVDISPSGRPPSITAGAPRQCNAAADWKGHCAGCLF